MKRFTIPILMILSLCCAAQECDEPSPFFCNTRFYQLAFAQLQVYVQMESELELVPVGPTYEELYSSVNSAGYNVLDNFMYGTGSLASEANTFDDQLVRIDANGIFCNLGTIEGMQAVNSWKGDFDLNGRLHIIDDELLFIVDVENVLLESVVNLDYPTSSLNDIAYNPVDGLFYSLSYDGTWAASIDASTGDVTVLPLSPPAENCGSGFGSVWIDVTGEFFGVCNVSGSISKVDLLSLSAAVITGPNEPNFDNDGISCPLAEDIFNDSCPFIEAMSPGPNYGLDCGVFSLSATGLLNMTEDENGEQDFGIQFVAFEMPTANPYNGGVLLGEVSQDALAGSNTTATINIDPANQPSGQYYVYAILDTPSGQDDCLPLAVLILDFASCDCAGVLNGSAIIDDCGDCNEPDSAAFNQSCQDCFGIPNGEAFINDCGDCVLPNDPTDVDCLDCAGLPNGPAIIDDCGECLSPLDPSFNTSCLDCEGTINGSAIIDECGECWDPNDLAFNQSCTDCAGVINGTFVLNLCNECVPAEEAQLDCLLRFPTAFSPNADGKNDYFGPKVRGVESIQWSIYNRWGEEVFMSQSVDDLWDGTYKGEAQEMGVYLLQASFTLKSQLDEITQLRQNLTLLR